MPPFSPGNLSFNNLNRVLIIAETNREKAATYRNRTYVLYKPLSTLTIALMII